MEEKKLTITAGVEQLTIDGKNINDIDHKETTISDRVQVPERDKETKKEEKIANDGDEKIV